MDFDGKPQRGKKAYSDFDCSSAGNRTFAK